MNDISFSGRVLEKSRVGSKWVSFQGVTKMEYHSMKRYVYATCTVSLIFGERLRARYVEHTCKERPRAHYVERNCSRTS